MEAREIETELQNIADLIKPIGYILEDEQPHISGERFLMMKEKLGLLGMLITK